jgi:hypothetical protein
MLQLLAKRALAGVFDDNEVRILVDAFDQAWNAVQDSGASVLPRAHSEAARELLALRIIEMAQLGERDPVCGMTRCSTLIAQISKELADRRGVYTG